MMEAEPPARHNKMTDRSDPAWEQTDEEEDEASEMDAESDQRKQIAHSAAEAMRRLLEGEFNHMVFYVARSNPLC